MIGSQTLAAVVKSSAATQMIPRSNLEKRVAYANEHGKIFRISSSYRAPRVHNELTRRGFIEQQIIPWNSVYLNITSPQELHTIKDVKEYEQVVIYKIIGERPADFVWVSRSQHYHLYPNSRFVNRINIVGHDFTVKDDLCKYMNTIGSQNMLANDAAITFTQNYDCRVDSQAKTHFRKDFRIGCVIGLVLYLHQRTDLDTFFVDTGDSDARNENLIRLKALDLVFHVLVTYFNTMDGHIDARYVANNCELSDVQWSYICRTHHSIVNRYKKFRATAEQREMYISRIQYIADEIPFYWPERMLYGCRNIYLLKPVTSGNGNGIILLDNERKILNVAYCKRRKYIIQK